MKIYKVKKNMLKWKEINQISFKWNLPILIDNEFNVLAGNCLNNYLSNDILVVIVNKNEVLEKNLYYIEQKVIEENSEKRFHTIYSEVLGYFNELRKPEVEQVTLFDEIKEKGIISEDNYILRKDSFKSHGPKKNEDYQIYLWEEESKEVSKQPRIKKNYETIEIDMEIMKEIL